MEAYALSGKSTFSMSTVHSTITSPYQGIQFLQVSRKRIAAGRPASPGEALSLALGLINWGWPARGVEECAHFTVQGAMGDRVRKFSKTSPPPSRKDEKVTPYGVDTPEMQLQSRHAPGIRQDTLQFGGRVRNRNGKCTQGSRRGRHRWSWPRGHRPSNSSSHAACWTGKLLQGFSHC